MQVKVKVKEKKNTEWRDCIADYVLEVGNYFKTNPYLNTTQCVERRQRPRVTIPVAWQEDLIRSKAPKPEKSAAIAKHQTRGLSK